MSKRTIDFLGHMLKDLEGNECAGSAMHKIVANAIASHKGPDPVKIMTLAQDLYRTGRIEVDDSDFDIVEQAVRGTEQLIPFHKGQILVLLKAAKE